MLKTGLVENHRLGEAGEFPQATESFCNSVVTLLKAPVVNRKPLKFPTDRIPVQRKICYH